MKFHLSSFFLLICTTVTASDLPLAGIDPLFYVQEGWQWGAFDLPDTASIGASDNGIVLDIGPADEGDWPGTTNGGLGISFGGMTYDQDAYDLEVRFRVLDDNDADQFRIILNEPDNAEVPEEFQYYFDGLLDQNVDEWVTMTRPLTDALIYPETGDGVPDAGLASLQIGLWDTPGALNVEIGSILLKPKNSVPDGTMMEFNSNVARRAWRWGAFNDAAADIVLGDNIVLDIAPAEEGDTPGTVSGGMGTAWVERELDGDPEDYEIVVSAKLGENNEATAFNVVLFDNDGLSEIASWDPRELEQEAEEFQFQFSTDALDEDGFVEIRQSLADPGPIYRQKIGASLFDGDGEINPGLYGIQIQSVYNSVEHLHLEVASIRVVDTRFVATEPCDVTGDGVCDVDDIDALSAALVAESNDAKYDINNDGSVNDSDLVTMIVDEFNTYFGDANLDGEFNSSDFVFVFGANKYESGQMSSWAEGDWNGDQRFDSSDFVAAFSDGGYEKGPRPAAVPEPSSFLLTLVAFAGVIFMRR